MEDHVLGIATQVIVMAIVISVILLFLGIGVLVLIHACIVGSTVGREPGDHRNVAMADRASLGSTSMSRDDIEKLPCFDFEAKGRGSSPAADCAVCLENFRVGEKCRLLPSCNHSFHAECVDLWLLRAPVCPICRAGAECMDVGSVYGEERNSFVENGGGNVTVFQRESGDFNGDELGMSQVEILDSGRYSFPDGQGTGREALYSSERVIEVREWEEN